MTMTDDMLDRLSDRDTLIRALTNQQLVSGDQALAGLLADHVTLKEYSVAGDLITEGKSGQEYLYCILSGKVQVLVGGKVVAEGGNGDAFGEFPILNPGTRHDVTLRASTPCVAALVHERDVRTVASEHGVLWENMANMIAKRLRAMNVDVRHKGPRVFVSHRHVDSEVAKTLATVLEAAFDISSQDIRCTSVQPYCLPVGDRTPDRLREEIRGAQVAMGLISPSSSESTYVMFELGASWGNGVRTLPLLIRGATYGDVPEPISDRNAISLENEENCMQLIDDMDDATSLERRQGVSARIAEDVRKLASVARAPEAL